MDLRQLAALSAVADHRSFSKAARALHTVQSNVSSHVARLEQELGVRLVERATGQLTEAGAIVVHRSRRIQAEIDALAADVASLSDEVSGTVRIGMIGTTGRWMVPLLLPAVAEAHPRIQVTVVDATTSSLAPRVASGELDLSVVNLPVDNPDVHTEALFDEERIVVAPTGHPLARHDRVSIAELANHPLLLEPPGTSFRDELDTAMASTGIHLTPQAEIDGMRLLASLAFEGFGAAVLPASAASRRASPDWRIVVVDGLANRSVGLATRRRSTLSAPARATRDVLRQVVSSDALRHPGILLPGGGSA